MCGFTGFRHHHSRWAHMMGWPPFATPGKLRLALLALVAEEPASGYELMQKLDERAGGYYRIRAQTIYPVLQQLEDEGLAVAELHEGRRVYRITEAGRRELQRRSEEVQDLWCAGRRPREWYRDLDAAAADIRDAAEGIARGVRRALSDELSAGRIARVREILERSVKDLEDVFRNPH
jgi:DNA-binding PadR family transcriptional regulator